MRYNSSELYEGPQNYPPKPRQRNKMEIAAAKGIAFSISADLQGGAYPSYGLSEM